MNKFISFVFIALISTCLSFLLTSKNSYANNTHVNSDLNNNTPLRIAVSSNFSPALAKLIPNFLQETGIPTEIISGSSGTLYQQILHGAPYDMFLSADDMHPQRLKKQLQIVKGSLQTYAQGQLAFWSAAQPLISPAEQKNQQQDLSSILSSYLVGNSKIAIANPNTAPYGQRALEVLKALNLWQSFQQNIITGINVNQTFQQVRSQAVIGGFVALSQLKLNNLEGLTVPENLYTPIKQQLVILKNSKQITAAKKLAAYLQRPKIQETIAEYGYKNVKSISSSNYPKQHMSALTESRL